MLVLSRRAGESIYVGTDQKDWVVTVSKLVENGYPVEFAVRYPSRAVATVALGRHQHQELGDGVTITIIEVRNDKVRLGIEAPRGMAVHRLEIYELLTGKHPLDDG